MPVAEMLSRISSRELTEWSIFYQLEPFGNEVNFYGHAITAATIANTHRKKGVKAFKPEDFMPVFEKPEQTVDEQIVFAKMMTVALGGKDMRKKA